MVRSSFLVVYLYAISLQLQLKGHFSKSLEELLFETCQWYSDGVFEKVRECRNFTSYFTIASPNNTIIAILKFLEHSQETFVMKSVFSIFLGNRLDSLNYLKNFTKDVFLGIFWNFQNRSISLKNIWNHFFISVRLLDSNLVTLIKRVCYRSFLSVFPAISEH